MRVLYNWTSLFDCFKSENCVILLFSIDSVITNYQHLYFQTLPRSITTYTEMVATIMWTFFPVRRPFLLYYHLQWCKILPILRIKSSRNSIFHPFYNISWREVPSIFKNFEFWHDYNPYRYTYIPCKGLGWKGCSFSNYIFSGVWYFCFCFCFYFVFVFCFVLFCVVFCLFVCLFVCLFFNFIWKQVSKSKFREKKVNNYTGILLHLISQNYYNIIL